MRALSIIFLLITGLVILFYLLFLIQKIEQPHYKNLGTEEFIWLGVILFPCLLVDILIVRKLLISYLKNKNEQH